MLIHESGNIDHISASGYQEDHYSVNKQCARMNTYLNIAPRVALPPGQIDLLPECFSETKRVSSTISEKSCFNNVSN